MIEFHPLGQMLGGLNRSGGGDEGSGDEDGESALDAVVRKEKGDRKGMFSLSFV